MLKEKNFWNQNNVALEKLKEPLIYYLDWGIEFNKPLKTKMSLFWSSYLDLKSAFDKVWGKGLIYKLCKYGLRGNILKWLDNYFKDRKIQVRLDGHLSSKFDISAGTLQGAVCSPLLFNLMTVIPTYDDIEQYMYADDITVICMGQDIKKLKLRMQKFLDDFVLWTETWGLKSIQPKLLCRYAQENELKFQYFESKDM